MRAALMVAVVVAAGLAACAGRAPEAGCVPPCESGPYTLRGGTFERVEVEGAEGTVLRGFLYRPDVEAPVPVVLVSGPYLSILGASEPNRSDWGNGNIDRLVAEGFAAAYFSVRGTGISDGCFENKGWREQEDQVRLVEWAAAQPWSNGRVAMAGISYMGTTPLMAAIQAPPALKAVVVMGPVTDPYTELHTPQGALYLTGPHNDALRRGLVGLLPPYGQPVQDWPATVTHVCADTARMVTVAARGMASDDRDPRFWDERRLVAGFPNVTAAVLLAHGFQETAHPSQEDPAWAALSQAPKAFLLGQWDHETPRTDTWGDEVIAWLSSWLRDGATPAHLGTVRYEDTGGTWRTADSWPPPARSVALHLVDGELVPQAGDGGAFRSAPLATRGPIDLLCGGIDPLLPGDPPRALRFEAPPTAGVLAGNPVALLDVESDQPGGILSLHLFARAEPCASSPLLSTGAADLRFHAGNLVGQDFPVGTPTPVRIDLTNLAAPVGGQLVLVASWGEAPRDEEANHPVNDVRHGRAGQPYYPVLRIHAGSQVVLPVLEGGWVGAEPAAMPPRPFVP